jgi:hypothetical protein
MLKNANKDNAMAKISDDLDVLVYPNFYTIEKSKIDHGYLWYLS